MQKNSIKQNPWLWVPTLYFAEGIPYFVVNNISVLLMAKMGVSNAAMSFFTSLIYLPWVIKPFWSPFVDVLKTKRWWIVAMQALVSVSLIALVLTMPRPSPATIAAGATPVSLFSIMLIVFTLMAFASATHDIAADGFYMLALSEHQQAAFVGIRSTFYRISMLFGQGVLVYIAGVIELRTNDIPMSWRVALLTAAIVFAALTLWHLFFIPKVEQSASPSVSPMTTKDVLHSLGRSVTTFFSHRGVALSIVFMLLYRLPEAFLVKMCTPFLVASPSAGGLGLSTEMVGIIYGTVGAIALTLGGILGGLFSAKVGLKRALWPMAVMITLPDLVYVYFAFAHPSNLYLISAFVAVEQFGYGFGFTAYMLYMMYISEGEFKTSHYAICTAFMALSMMLPGFVAGTLQECLGYAHFFILVMVCCLVTVAVTALISRQVRADYGCKTT